MASKTWTTTAQFNSGTYVATNASDVANQVQFDAAAVANIVLTAWSAYEQGEVLVVADDGASAPLIVGRFAVGASATVNRPSRIAWCSDGTFWVFSLTSTFTDVKVTRFGVVIGGTRCNSDGTVNPSGTYRKAPFTMNTTGVAIVQSWIPGSVTTPPAALTFGTDGALIEQSIDLPVTVGSGGFGLAVDSSNAAWVAHSLPTTADPTGTLTWYKIAQGLTVTPYTNKMGLGVAWYDSSGSAIYGVPRNTTTTATFRYVKTALPGVTQTATTIAGLPTATKLPSCTLSTDASRLWISCSRGDVGSFGTIMLYSTATNTLLATTGTPPDNRYENIDTMWADLTDNDVMWCMESVPSGTLTSRLYKMEYDGSSTLAVTSYSMFGPTGWGTFTTNTSSARVDGMCIDPTGKMWIKRRGGRLQRVDLSLGPVVDQELYLETAQVALSNQQNGGKNVTQYNTATNPTAGSWEATYDAGVNTDWTTISWNDTVDSDQTLTIQYQVSSTLEGLNGNSWTVVATLTAEGLTSHSEAMAGEGRYVRVMVVFARGITDTGTSTLRDLTIVGTDDDMDTHPAGHYLPTDPLPLDPTYGGWDGQANVSGTRIAVASTAGAQNGV